MIYKLIKASSPGWEKEFAAKEAAIEELRNANGRRTTRLVKFQPPQPDTLSTLPPSESGAAENTGGGQS